MEFTFDDDISEEMRNRLSGIYTKGHEVGIPVTQYVTAKPGVDLSRTRQSTEGNLASYRFDVEGESCHVTIRCGCHRPDGYGISGVIKCNRCELTVWDKS